MMPKAGRRSPGAWSGAGALGFALACAFGIPLLGGCNQDVAGPKGDIKADTLYNPAIDSLAFWPPAMRYARAGDTISIRMRGLRLGYACGAIASLKWSWEDSLGSDYYTLFSTIVPGGPSCRSGGVFDSTFRVIFHSHAGERLFVGDAGRRKRDSLLFLSGFGYTESFAHHDSDPDSSVIELGGYRFVFLDSTAARPVRRVAAVLPTCETFQSALFKREGDSILVRLRRIVANPLPPSLFPACAGEHADTIEVARDLYGSF